MYVLQIDSSADVVCGASRQLTGEFAAAWVAAGPDRETRIRDLHTQPIPHLSTSALHLAGALRPDHMTEPEPQAVSLQEELIAELADAEVVVIGAPMYNFSMPSALKAWLDQVHVMGRTSSTGDEPLPMHGKPVVVVSPRVSPTGADPLADFVVGPFHTVLGDAMGMRVTSFVAHVVSPLPPGDFHRPMDEVCGELREFAAHV